MMLFSYYLFFPVEQLTDSPPHIQGLIVPWPSPRKLPLSILKSDKQVKTSQLIFNTERQLNYGMLYNQHIKHIISTISPFLK